MTISYVQGIPAANNSPAQDQPDMLTNTGAVFNIWDINHNGFNKLAAVPGGTHTKVDIPLFTNPTLVAGAESSVIYTKAGTADPTHAQAFFKNPFGDFLLSGVRAFGMFVTGAAGNIAPSNAFNLIALPTAIVQATVGLNTEWTITLAANATTTDNAAVFIYFDRLFSVPNPSYTFASNVLTIRATSFGPFAKVSFLVLQI
jgi:hypothetical protein